MNRKIILITIGVLSVAAIAATHSVSDSVILAFYSQTQPVRNISLDTNQTLIGQSINPVTVKTIIIPPGHETGFHTHNDIVIGYVMSGEITVDYGDHSVTLEKGESGVQAINHTHNEINTGSFPTEILIVEIGN